VALASLFGTNVFQYEPGGVIEFYEAYPAVREVFAQSAAWTGLDEQELLRQNGTYRDTTHRLQVASVGLASAQLAIQDVLIDKGLRPAVVGGLSLGGLVSSAVAGAVSRRELMEMLLRGEHQPVEEGPEEGLASAYVLPDRDLDDYLAGHEGVYLSSDFGRDAGEQIRIVMLAGYRDALEKLAADDPGGMISVTPGADVAVHTPLRAHNREQSRAYVDTIAFTDPVLPLCSCLEPKTLTTAAEVHDLFLDNVVEPISLVHLNTEMLRHGTQLGLVLGPSPVMNSLHYPFPTVFVDAPAAVPRAIAAIFDYGVSLPD
jgi:[acyl-carrier-protein] S-malonyltransferase